MDGWIGSGIERWFVRFRGKDGSFAWSIICVSSRREGEFFFRCSLLCYVVSSLNEGEEKKDCTKILFHKFRRIKQWIFFFLRTTGKNRGSFWLRKIGGERLEESVDLLRIMQWYFDNYPIIIFVKLVKISKNSRPNWNDYSIHSRILWKKESCISFWDRLWERDYTTSTRKIFESRESKDRPIPSGEREREGGREQPSRPSRIACLCKQAPITTIVQSQRKKFLPTKFPSFLARDYRYFERYLIFIRIFKRGERGRGGVKRFRNCCCPNRGRDASITSRKREDRSIPLPIVRQKNKELNFHRRLTRDERELASIYIPLLFLAFTKDISSGYSTPPFFFDEKRYDEAK